jgi:adenosylhomocysteine nucleosidase
MPKVAIVTAMPTEVWPLIRSWEQREFEHAGHHYRFYEHNDAVALCGGIGYEAGQRAAEASIAYARPDLLIAAGLAGGLKPEWTLGKTLTPATIIDEASGQRYATLRGAGTVVSSRVIAGVELKRDLAARFAADIVDMEGAAIASVAAKHGVPLMAAKAVSDALDFPLPPLQPFVDKDGRFQSVRFTLHAAVRPAWWPLIWKLKHHSDTAAEALADLLTTMIRDTHSGPRSSYNSVLAQNS